MNQPLLSVEDNMEELSKEARYSPDNQESLVVPQRSRKRSNSSNRSLIRNENLRVVFGGRRKKPSLFSRLKYMIGLAFLQKKTGEDAQLDIYYETREVNQQRDFIFRLKGLTLFIMAMVGVFLMIVSQMINFQWWYGAEDDGTTGLHIYSPDAKGFEVQTLRVIYQSINIANCLCTIVCLSLLTDYYLYYAKLKQETWKFNNVFEALVNTSLLRKYVMEFIIIAFTPIPFLESINASFFSNKWSLLMFARYYLAVRVIRDFSLVYRKRSKIIKYNSEFKKMIPEFGWQLTFRMLFYNHTIIVLFITSIISTMTAAFCIWIVERNVHNKGLSFYYNNLYFTLVTMTTIGYGDYSPKETAGRLAAVLQGLLGILIVTIFSGVVINKLTPTEEQEETANFFNIEKLLKTRLEECIRVLQVQWLYKKGKCTAYYRHIRIKKSIKKLYFVRRRLLKLQNNTVDDTLHELLNRNRILKSNIAHLSNVVLHISDQIGKMNSGSKKSNNIRKTRFIASSPHEKRSLFIVEENVVYPVRFSEKLGYMVLKPDGHWYEIPIKRRHEIFTISSTTNKRIYIIDDDTVGP